MTGAVSIGRRAFLAGAGASLLAAPGVARAQQRPQRVPRIALVASNRAREEIREDFSEVYRAFWGELRRLSRVDGGNIAIVPWSGLGRDADGYVSFAREIVASAPHVIVANAARLVGALKAATSVIPIVGITVDPIAAGLVQSIARPGGNLTGFSVDGGVEMEGKRLELVARALPGAKRIGYITAQATWMPGAVEIEARRAAQVLGLALVPAFLESPIVESSYRKVFADLAGQQVAGVVPANRGENWQFGPIIASLALAGRLPTIVFQREHVEAGALMCYAPSITNIYRQVAGYVDRILNGETPANLPYQQPREFEFVINLKTAKAIGIEIPYQVLALATEVIE